PRRRDLSRSRRADVSAIPRRLPGRPSAPPLRVDDGPHARSPPADPPRSDPPAPLSRAELDRRHARLPAALRLLLQGRVLPGRTILLHAARGRCTGRDRSAAGTASLL